MSLFRTIIAAALLLFAGLLLAETEYRREIEVTIEPFQGLLLGLFFVSVGADLDLSRLVSHPAEIIAIAIGIVALKGLVVLAAAALFQIPRPVAREMALLLGPGGEFAFVMLGAATLVNAVPREVAESAMVAVTLSMLLIPIMARLGEAARSAYARRFSIRRTVAVLTGECGAGPD